MDLANLTAWMEKGMRTFGTYERRNCTLLVYTSAAFNSGWRTNNKTNFNYRRQ